MVEKATLKLNRLVCTRLSYVSNQSLLGKGLFSHMFEVSEI